MSGIQSLSNTNQTNDLMPTLFNAKGFFSLPCLAEVLLYNLYKLTPCLICSEAMEKSHNILKQKLGFFDILKVALLLICKNHNFIVLTFLTSLPLFCFSVYYELLLQRTLVQISEFVKQHLGYFDHNWPILLHTSSRMVQTHSTNLIQLGFLYLVPLHLLELCTVFVIVDLASKIHVQGKTTFREIVGSFVTTKAQFRGPLVTSIWVLCLSTCTVLGSIWLVSIYYVILRNLGYNLYFIVLYRAACMALVGKYLELSALWNMSIVISILENVHGANALMLSEYYLSKDREWQGHLFTLVFCFWGLGLRLSCLFFECYERGSGIVAQSSLLCVVNVMKWVTYMIYFYNCKKQILEKKAEGEMGIVVEKYNQRTEKTGPNISSSINVS